MMIGLGVDTTPPTDPICTGASLYLDPFCWGLSLGQSAASGGKMDMTIPGNYPNPPAPLPPGAPVATDSNPNPLVTPPASGADASNTVDATIAAEVAANQAQYLNFFNQVAASNPPPACTQSILPALDICDSTIYWGLAIVGLAFVAFVKVR